MGSVLAEGGWVRQTEIQKGSPIHAFQRRANFGWEIDWLMGQAENWLGATIGELVGCTDFVFT